MNLLVFGSRNFHGEDFIHEKISELLNWELERAKKEVNIISGGASGVDWYGVTFSIYELDKDAILFKPDWDRYGKGAGFVRNEEMVKIADQAIGFIFENSNGSEHTLKLCRKKGIPTRIFRITQEDYI